MQHGLQPVTQAQHVDGALFRKATYQPGFRETPGIFTADVKRIHRQAELVIDGIACRQVDLIALIADKTTRCPEPADSEITAVRIGQPSAEGVLFIVADQIPGQIRLPRQAAADFSAPYDVPSLSDRVAFNSMPKPLSPKGC